MARSTVRTVLVAIAVGGALLLAGCAVDVAPGDLPVHSVARMERGLFDAEKFIYLNSSRNWVTIECKKESFWEYTVCESKDGDLRFEPRYFKAGASLREGTSNGKSVDFMRVSSDVPKSREVWVPSR